MLVIKVSAIQQNLKKRILKNISLDLKHDFVSKILCL